MLDPNNFKGMVEGPGKFEGEPRAAEYYWELAMNGMGEDIQLEEDGTLVTLFTVDEEEGRAFEREGILAGDTVVVFEDSQGFVELLPFRSKDDALAYIARWID